MDYLTKKYYFYISAYTTLISCGGSDIILDLITTNISVIASVNTITWTNTSDLLQKLDTRLSYNYGLALKNETEKQ